MKTTKLTVILSVSAMAVYGAFLGFAADEVTKSGTTMPKANTQKWDFLPNVVAKVGEKDLTKDDFIKNANKIMKHNPMLAQRPPKDLAKMITNEIVETMVLSKIAADGGIKPEPKLVDNILALYDAEIAKLPPEKIKQISETLAKRGSNFDKEREHILKLKEDKDALEGLAINKWIDDNIVKKTEVTDDELKNYYEQNKQKFTKPPTISASHILIKPKAIPAGITDEKEKAEAKAKALEAAKVKCKIILDKIKAGEKFEDLAVAESDCPSGKSKKGSLGQFGKGSMVPEFENACNKLAVGQISEPVKTRYGYHIIRLDGRNKASIIPLDNIKQFIKPQLKNMKIQNGIKKAIEKEKEKIVVQLFI